MRLNATVGKLLAAVVMTAAASVHAQAYPNRPITLVVGFGAGGGTDTAARMVAKDLAAELKQSVVVENRAGAGGAIGAASVAKAQPDRYTLFFGSGSELTVLPAIRRDPPYDTLKQFQPVALVGTVSFMLVAHPSIAATSIAELISLARSQAGAVSYASYGIGSTNHLIGELFAHRTGTRLLHVPYKGSAAAATDLMAGQVQVAFDTVSVMLQHVQSGKLKGLAVLSPTRSQLAPMLPTFAEAGVPDFVVEGWMGVLAPVGTPGPIVDRLAQALDKVLKKPQMVEALRQRGVHTASGTPQQFGAFIASELSRWQSVARTAAIQID